MNTEELINHFSEVKIEDDNRDSKYKNQQWNGRSNRYTMGRNIRNLSPQYGRNYRNNVRGRGYISRNAGRGRGRGG
jgi:hypothetical protein